MINNLQFLKQNEIKNIKSIILSNININKKCSFNSLNNIRKNIININNLKYDNKNILKKYISFNNILYNRTILNEINHEKIDKNIEKHIETIYKEKLNSEKKKQKFFFIFLLSVFISIYFYYESYNPEFFMYDILLKFFIKYVDSELCHDIFIFLGKYNLLPYDTTKDSIYSTTKIKNIDFINPIGIAAGFDKNGESIESLLKLGFSFIEIGTITPKKQEGNQKPRIFRDIETKCVLNSCGFNNIGCDKVKENLKKFRKKQKKDKYLMKNIVGVSIGKNKDSSDIVDDLIYCIKKIAKYSDYIAINISSPNTVGLRDNQESNKLRNIIKKTKNIINNLDVNEINQNNVECTLNNNTKKILKDENISFIDNIIYYIKNNIYRKYILKSYFNVNCETKLNKKNFWKNTTKQKPLIFVKLSPDLLENEKKEIAKVLLEEDVDGIIISNTTIQNMNIKNFENKKGGLSGSKLKNLSTKLISDMYIYTNKKIPIIAVGGIFNGADVLEKIESGASVCQLYTALVFNGMKTAVQIKREFDQLLYKKGYYNLTSAIGSNHKKKKKK